MVMAEFLIKKKEAFLHFIKDAGIVTWDKARSGDKYVQRISRMILAKFFFKPGLLIPRLTGDSCFATWFTRLRLTGLLQSSQTMSLLPSTK